MPRPTSCGPPGPTCGCVSCARRSPPGRALDVAAGEGRNALWLVERGWTVTAADFSPVAVSRIRDVATERLDEAARPPARGGRRGRDAARAGHGIRPRPLLLPPPRARGVGAGRRGRRRGGSGRWAGARRGARAPQPRRGRRGTAGRERSCWTPRTSSPPSPPCRSRSSSPRCGRATSRRHRVRRSTRSSSCAAPRTRPAERRHRQASSALVRVDTPVGTVVPDDPTREPRSP